MPRPHLGLKGEDRCGTEWVGMTPQPEQRNGYPAEPLTFHLANPFHTPLVLQNLSSQTLTSIYLNLWVLSPSPQDPALSILK